MKSDVIVWEEARGLMIQMFAGSLLLALDAECVGCTHSHQELSEKLAERLVDGPEPKLRVVK